MQIRDALKWGVTQLPESDTPILDARLLLMHAMSCSVEYLFLNFDCELDQEILDQFFQLIKKRANHQPIAYILGKQEFYGLDFIVNHHVLIPRPETELIVDIVKDLIGSGSEVDILELGTGSGALSISIAKEVAKSRVLAIDISDEALEIAKTNIINHKVHHQVTLLKSDWYSNLPDKTKYDFIISNPPYICHSETNQMSKETVMFEPDLALYAENNGLSCYESIIAGASQFLKKDGKLILEIGYSQKDNIAKLLESFGFRKIVVKTDLAGLDRVIIAR